MPVLVTAHPDLPIWTAVYTREVDVSHDVPTALRIIVQAARAQEGHVFAVHDVSEVPLSFNCILSAIQVATQGDYSLTAPGLRIETYLVGVGASVGYGAMMAQRLTRGLLAPRSFPTREAAYAWARAEINRRR